MHHYHHDHEILTLTTLIFTITTLTANYLKRYVRSQRWLARLQLKPSHLSRAKHCIVRWAAERPEAGASENQRPLLQPHGIKKNPCPQIEMKSRSFETWSTDGDGDGDDDVDLDCILIIV